MVKNSTGGNKSKGFARKNLTKKDNKLRIAQEEGEIYAQAVKVMGGSIVSAIDINGNQLRGHIRGKFRGRGKRDNFISPNTWLLVGLHSWENNEEQIKNCDVLEVYSETDKTRLKNTINNVNWSKFIANDNLIFGNNDNNGTTNDDDIILKDETIADYENLFQSKKKTTNIIMDNDEDEINVDDI